MALHHARQVGLFLQPQCVLGRQQGQRRRTVRDEGQPVLQLRAVAAVCLYLRGQARNILGTSCICLLYTSDAADE